jgi:sulfur carrier protein ThiS
MKITVIFFGDFVRFKPEGWERRRGTVEVPDGATIDTLAEQLGIADEPCVVMLNEEQNHRAAELHEGDTVTFLPPIAGGSTAGAAGALCTGATGGTGATDAVGTAGGGAARP